MSGASLVWLLLAACVVGAIVRPWTGCVAYYGFALLQPHWNWRWAIPSDVGMQKYIAIATLLGFALTAGKWATLPRVPHIACAALLTFVTVAWIGMSRSVDLAASQHAFNAFWKIALMALVTIRLIDTEKKLWYLLWTVSIAHTYNALRITEDYLSQGYCQYVETGWGFGIGSNQAAIIAVCCSAVTAGLVVAEKTLFRKLLPVLMLGLQMHEIMLLESRGTMLGAVVMAMVVLSVMPRTGPNLSATLLAVLAAGVLAGPSVTSEFSTIFRDRENRDASAESRFYTWRAGFRVALEKPFVGAGFGASSALVPRYYAIDENSPLAKWKNVHNLPIEVAADCGFPAAVCYYVWFLAIPFGVMARFRSRGAGPSSTHGAAVAAGVANLAGTSGALVATMFSSGMLVEAFYLLAVIGAASLTVQMSAVAEHVDSQREQTNRHVTPRPLRAPGRESVVYSQRK